mmetsp:Transcript_4416/g.10478  ORF Transcript_4416/g.10478 Transcript_4416/m.10478 type:complete len:663 (-) Transcript_4416:125-2113(-)
MDVDDDNFEEGLKVFLEHLPTSSFVGIDLEMTGIHLGDETMDNPQDTLEARYVKKREAASNYSVIQVGICLFHQRKASETEPDNGNKDPSVESSQFEVRPFNFFVFPRPVNEPPDCYISPKVTLDTDAMHFVRCSGLDFGRWLGKGIPFLDRPSEELLSAALAKRTEAPYAEQDLQGKAPEESARREARGIEEQFGKPGFCPGSKHVLRNNVHRHKHTVQAMRERRKDDFIVLERRSGPLGGCRAPVATLRNLGPSSDSSALEDWKKQEKEEAERLLNYHTGFRRVWRALLQSGKPLILHNGFLDMLYGFHWFEEPLPGTLDEFKQLISRSTAAGTKFYDTKWIAHLTEKGIKLEHGQRTSLEQLTTLVDKKATLRTVGADGFERYDGAATSYHEAAYDALCTGKLFAYFCQGTELLTKDAVSPATETLNVVPSESSESSLSEAVSSPPAAHLGPPTVETAGNRIFLMLSSQDFRWGDGESHPSLGSSAAAGASPAAAQGAASRAGGPCSGWGQGYAGVWGNMNSSGGSEGLFSPAAAQQTSKQVAAAAQFSAAVKASLSQQQQQQHQEQPDPTTAPRNFSGSSGSMGRSTLRSVATSSSVEQAIRADFGGLEVLLGMLRELAVFSDNMGTLSDECLLAVHSVMTMTTPQTSDKADLSRTLG